MALTPGADNVNTGSINEADVNLDILTMSQTLIPATHRRVQVDAAGGNVALELPVADPSIANVVFFIKRYDSSFSITDLTLNASNTQTIDGSTDTINLGNLESIEVMCDGAEWHIISSMYSNGFPNYPGEMYDSSGVDVPIDLAFSKVTWDQISIDRSNGEYTLDLAQDEISFDKADGKRVYEISVKVSCRSTSTVGAQRTSVELMPYLGADSAEIPILYKSLRTYVRETTDPGDTAVSLSGSLLVQPNNGDKFFFEIRKDKTTACSYDRRYIYIKRVC